MVIHPLLCFQTQAAPDAEGRAIHKAFEQAAAASVHLIAQVKADQPALHHAIATLCDTAAPVDSTQTADKKRRCRDETRTVEVFAPGGSLADTEWDGHIRAIIRVSRDVLTRSATTGLSRLRGFGRFDAARRFPINGLAEKVFTTGGDWVQCER